jgi:hypothetical protein
VQVTDADGCESFGSKKINYGCGDLEVSLFATMESAYGASDAIINSSVTGGTAPYSYEWSTGDQGTTLNNVPAGVYSLEVTDATGCTLIEEVIVELDCEEMDITIITNDESYDGASDGYVIANVSGGQAPYTYDWNNGASDQQTYLNLEAGDYSIVVVDSRGCLDSSSTTINVGGTITGLDENEVKFEVYPNPVDRNTILNVLATGIEGNYSIMIFDILGKLIYSEQIDQAGLVQLNVSQFESGVYNVQLIDAKHLLKKKVILQ